MKEKKTHNIEFNETTVKLSYERDDVKSLILRGQNNIDRLNGKRKTLI